MELVLLSPKVFDRIICLSLNDKRCMVRPTDINLNHVELKYYPFLISLDECTVSFSSCNDLPRKIRVPRKAKDINVNEFDTITNRNEGKTSVKHISGANGRSLSFSKVAKTLFFSS